MKKHKSELIFGVIKSGYIVLFLIAIIKTISMISNASRLVYFGASAAGYLLVETIGIMEQILVGMILLMTYLGRRKIVDGLIVIRTKYMR